MYLEEQLEALLKNQEDMKNEIAQLRSMGSNQFVTPGELAEIMKCTPATVHRKIKSGEICVTRKLGDPKIPMNQFYNIEPTGDKKEDSESYLSKTRRSKPIGKELSMAELVFGKGGTP